MTPGMARVHRRIIQRNADKLSAVFIDTPAGFELNSAAIAQKAREYFREQFECELMVASFTHAASTTLDEVTAALTALRTANYIFAGPGSPTYAVVSGKTRHYLRQWLPSSRPESVLSLPARRLSRLGDMCCRSTRFTRSALIHIG
jgi:hypothetical protein